MELRQVSQSQKRALDDIATLKAQLNTVKTELKNTSVTLSEKDGCTLTLEKDIKRLKANLKLSQNENDQWQVSIKTMRLTSFFEMLTNHSLSISRAFSASSFRNENKFICRVLYKTIVTSQIL